MFDALREKRLVSEINRRGFLRAWGIMKYIFLGLAVLFGGMQVDTPANAMNCVEYVKYATGLNLMGNAYQWWYSADNVLERGYQPAAGAIMVFDRTARMHVGHVAMVREIVSSREILIDQANWHHGRVEHGTSVIDTSAANDWSSVQVAWTPNVYGGPFPITGFIYTDGTPAYRGEAHLMQASYASRGHGGTTRRVSNHVRIGTGSGHLVMADLAHSKRGGVKLASLPAHESTSHTKASSSGKTAVHQAECVKPAAKHDVSAHKASKTTKKSA